MTTDEVGKVFKVLLTADGGCSVCVRRIIQEFIDKFPETKQEILKLVEKDEELELEDFE